jgi:hypothetical protein
MLDERPCDTHGKDEKCTLNFGWIFGWEDITFEPEAYMRN